MGLSFSSLFALWSIKDARVALIGLDNAGKSEILSKLAFNEKQKESVPTIGFHNEVVQYKNIKFGLWDVGGQASLRRLWSNFFTNCHAVIYVVDSNDVNRIKESAEELHRHLAHPDLAHATLLIYANKQDLPNAVPVSHLYKMMKIDDIQKKYPSRKIFVQGCCAISPKADGLYEGLNFLVENLPSESTFDEKSSS